MKKIVILILLTIYLIPLIGNVSYAAEDTTTSSDTTITTIIGDYYKDVLQTWRDAGYRDDINYQGVISPLTFSFEQEDGSLSIDPLYDEYFENVNLPNEALGNIFIFNNQDDQATSIKAKINVPNTGLYKIGIDYYSLTESIENIEIEVQINGVSPYYEATQIILPTYYSTSDEITQDRYGNDIMPSAEQNFAYHTYDFRDAARLYEQGILFKLESGENEIEIIRRGGNLKLGQIYVRNLEEYVSYSDYLSTYNAVPKATTEFLELEAENLSLKNSVSIRYTTDRNPTNTPYALVEAKLNVIDGGTYKSSGGAIYYNIDIPKTAFYQITLKSKISKENTQIFRTLSIDGKIPFDEAQRIAFSSGDWDNRTLKINDEPIWIYLTKGVHTIGLEVNSAPFTDIYNTVNEVMLGVNNIALDIKKLTGNQIDANRDWDIVDYMPNLSTDLENFARLIEESYNSYKEISNTSKDADVSSGLKAAYQWLYDLSSNPNDVPSRIGRLTGPTSSVLQRLGLILPLIIESPLTMDKLYIHGMDASLPNATAGFFETLWYEIQRFFASFFSSEYSSSSNPDELNIWVNRSRQYVNLMQQMADDTFTASTGIKVNISIMPNEDKLILAASSGSQPDLAMGVAGWRPYDFAIRNAVVDLSTFSNFREVTDSFKEGSFMQLIYQDGVYGLPETQNFNLLFYRRDILDALSLDVPDTWDDVISILPELQRYGMNFYSMLSSTTAFKSFATTMPYIMQRGGNLYAEGALKAAFDSQEVVEAMTLMTDLYTVYALPLEVGSFYNEFRYGNIPIGIGDFNMYIQLLYAAPEIAGLWEIAPLPGIQTSDGVNRSYDGASTSSMIFKNSSKQQEAWDFLTWWMSDSVQLNYAQNLISAFGPEYMWNTANVNAFSQMTIKREHRQVILDQWEYVLDTAKTPASYMLERELSNAWNRIVYDGVNVRTALEDSQVLVNKEISRKMIEFEFIDRNNNVLKEYILPTKETLGNWVHTDD